MILYCDVVSKKSKLALLDQDCNVLKEHDFGEKVSEEFHEAIYEISSNQEIHHLISPMGPGSYTGLRLIDLFSYLWMEEKKKFSSFYFFEYAHFLKKKFISYAYKQESFLVENEIKRLIPYEEKNYQDYTILPGEESYYLSGEVLYPFKNKDFLQEVMAQNRQLDPYYYRRIDDEFKKSSQKISHS